MTYPARPTRTGICPKLVEQRRITDPREELNVQTMELLLHQAAGVARVAPLVVFDYFGASNSDYMLTAWDTTQLGYRNHGTSSTVLLEDSSYITSVTVNGDNRVEVQFVDQVTDMRGNLVDLNFAFGLCMCSDDASHRGSLVIEAGSGGRQNLVTFGEHTSVAGTFVLPTVTVKLW